MNDQTLQAIKHHIQTHHYKIKNHELIYKNTHLTLHLENTQLTIITRKVTKHQNHTNSLITSKPTYDLNNPNLLTLINNHLTQTRKQHDP